MSRLGPDSHLQDILDSDLLLQSSENRNQDPDRSKLRILNEDPWSWEIEHVVGASEVGEPEASQSITGTKHDTGGSAAVWQQASF